MIRKIANTKNSSKRVIVLLSALLLVWNMFLPVTYVYAQTVPTPPTAPTPPAPTPVPSAPPIPTTYTTPTPTPTSTPRPTRTPTPTALPTVTEPTSTPVAVTSTPTPSPNSQTATIPTTTVQQVAPVTPTPTTNPHTITNELPTVSETTGGNTQADNNDGPVDIITGNADGVVNLSVEANSNTIQAGGGSGSGVIVENSGNGVNSQNDAVIDLSDTTVLEQNNTAVINNTVKVDLNTGDNRIKDNLGGGSSITTGDATSTVNIINLANTNLAGATVSSNEFNVLDSQTGDIYLTSGSNCGVSSGCAGGTGSAEVVNSANGSGSNNSGVIQSGNNVIITSNNNAEVNNSIDIELNTGDNIIRDSLGDASIKTGDANVFTNVVNFLNTSIVGVTEIVFNTVNVLAGFSGDIVLPGADKTSTQIEISNLANGAGSSNNGEVSIEDTTTINQANTASVTNEIVADANTGGNLVADAIAGDGDVHMIDTGSVNSEVGATTVANQNIVGNDINIILLNQSGVMSAYVIDNEGNLVPVTYQVTNEGNGSGSENTGAIHEVNNTEINQNNTATVNNTINIDANTGGNKVKDVIDGTTAIETGDVNIFSTVANFINNNFAGDRIVFTIVNDLFGLWTGNFSAGNDKQEVEPVGESMDELTDDEKDSPGSQDNDQQGGPLVQNDDETSGTGEDENIVPSTNPEPLNDTNDPADTQQDKSAAAENTDEKRTSNDDSNAGGGDDPANVNNASSNKQPEQILSIVAKSTSEQGVIYAWADNPQQEDVLEGNSQVQGSSIKKNSIRLDFSEAPQSSIDNKVPGMSLYSSLIIPFFGLALYGIIRRLWWLW